MKEQLTTQRTSTSKNKKMTHNFWKTLPTTLRAKSSGANEAEDQLTIAGRMEMVKAPTSVLIESLKSQTWLQKPSNPRKLKAGPSYNGPGTLDAYAKKVHR